ncbi:MAG: hypothetical protein ACREBU_14440 [Nitrososphaera sp.]
MSSPVGNSKNRKVRYAGIIASLVALGLILSPISPLSLQQGGSPTLAGEIEEPPQPEELTEQQIIACGSVIQGVEYIIGGGREQFLEEEEFFGDENATLSLTPEEKLASDLLVGEFCNRPELVLNMSSAYDPSITLVAYGCEAAAGRTGDAALQDSLGGYERLYCEPAADTIEFEADSLLASLEEFKAEILPALQSELENQGNANATGVVENAESVLDMTTVSANTAKELLSAGSIYEAARSLDQATIMYTNLIDSEEVSALLGLEEE